MHDDYVRAFKNRTTSLLGQEQMDALDGFTIGIAGCGGVGGAVALTLARLGVGGFVLGDPGIYDPPDANRQWAADRRTLDRNKAEVHAEILAAIRPDVRLRVFTEGITASNVEAFMDGVDLLIDCLDISVPLPLRCRVYQLAQERGIHAVTAPIWGFGTIVMWARPDGMGMDGIIERFIHTASTRGTLPPGFHAHLYGPHVQAIEAGIASHRVPSSGVSVALATSLVCADAARVLLQPHDPELPPLVTLPELLVVEPLRRTFRVCHWSEVFEDIEDPAARLPMLQACHQNPGLVPARDATHDLLSDSWADRRESWQPDRGDPDSVEAQLAERFGMPTVFTVFSGRFAESLVAPLVARPGTLALTNGAFPTGRFHLENAGAEVVDVTEQGQISLERLRAQLRHASVVWLEAGCNAYAGEPIEVEVLAEIRRLAQAHGVPVVLDACRLYTQVALQGADDLVEAARALVAHCDVLVASLTKDFQARRGATIAVRDPDLAQALGDRVHLMTGEGMTPQDRSELAGALARMTDAGIRERVTYVQSVADALRAHEVPVRVGGHAVFVDAATLLPDHGEPAWALARALFAEGGVRAVPNMGPDGQQWVRLAFPVALHRAPPQTFVERWPAHIPDVRVVGAAPGELAAFLVQLEVVCD